MSIQEIEQMIGDQIISRGIRSRRVLDAMRRVDRKVFVPAGLQADAYSDNALPVGYRATISQPYIVALMSELLDLQSDDKVLEVGCGTGYQTALLGELAREVWSLEIVPELAGTAAARLHELGYSNIHVLNRSGYEGLPEKAPFDKIIVTAAPATMPVSLQEQLRRGGTLVIPLGSEEKEQDLVVITKTPSGKYRKRNVAPVRFVPMVHKPQT